MPASPPELDRLLYTDALLELARAARTLATAIVRAAEAAERVTERDMDSLAARILDDCRAALIPALVRAPGMLQLFIASTENSNGVASDASDNVPGG